MKQAMFKAVAAAVSSLVLAAAACAQGYPGSQAWFEALQAVEVREVSETELRNFIAAVEDLDAMETGIDMGTPDMFEAIAASDEAMSALRRNDFSAESFRSTLCNLALALGALSMGGQEAKVVAQLEAMKTELPPDRYAQMEARLLDSIRLFERAPEANVALVEKYRDELRALGQ